ncbi:MAG: hypothetical protein J6V39_06965, partial [Clostridia bacterium]|nr:hypothetical protein [Clostridia bacterium]
PLFCNRHHTDDPLMKVFARLFQKAVGSWGKAPSRARRRETFPTAFFGSFLRQLAQKRTERVCSPSTPTGNQSQYWRAITDRPYLLRKNLYFPPNLCYNILNDIPRRIYETLTSLFGCLVDALSVRV